VAQTQALRQEGVPALNWPNDLRSLATNMDLQADNPIAYAYALLEASGEFTEATWNV